MADTLDYAPMHANDAFTAEEKHLLAPFFTNTDENAYAVSFLPPELIGALCSRASRAKEDLRRVFLNEFIQPFLAEKSEYGNNLQALIGFLHTHPAEKIFANPKGREFYIKWLAQYGDDSIAQMAGTHLVYSNLSLVAIKQFERMRMGIAPIEKSTRYVDYSTKINGQYRYYTDPKFRQIGLDNTYRQTMDELFDAYTKLNQEYFAVLTRKYPDEKESTLKAKAFDTIRGILPTSTLSQVAFFANGQAFEYAINRTLNHELGEVRWAAEAGYTELTKIIPAFLRRIESEPSQKYRDYLSHRHSKVNEYLTAHDLSSKPTGPIQSGVKLIDYDPAGEDKIIAALIYEQTHQDYASILLDVTTMSQTTKKELLDTVMNDRTEKWFKVPRAFENAYVTFEITANWAVWKDLMRHRMLTGYNELFHTHYGFDVPAELIGAGLNQPFSAAITKVDELFAQVEKIDPILAQYCVTQAHRLRFLQVQNLRSFFWETELRTIAQGHPDYRLIEQQKVKLLTPIYPLLMRYLKADMNDYFFARRSVEQSIEKKTKELTNYLVTK